MIISNADNRTLDVNEDEYRELLDQVLVDEEGLWLGTKEMWDKEAQELGQIPGYIMDEDKETGEVLVFVPDYNNEVH